MNNTAPTASPAAEYAAETSQRQREEIHDVLLHDSHSPLFNLLRKWYREAQEELAVKEQTLEETNINHQAELLRKDIEIASLTAQVAKEESTLEETKVKYYTELNKKDTEIASLTAQKAKLNSALADSTREIEEATRTTFKHLAEINKKDTENARLTAQVAKGESALEETKIKHQAEINKKDFEIASLTAQKAKLNSLLAGSTREVERAIEIIGRFNNFTEYYTELNKKDTEIASLTAQKAKLNSALADSTREIEEATRTTFKHLAEINKKDTENARLTAQVAKGESALEETKIKHQAEINKKDFEIASLTAQKAKLNSLLAGSTREVERAIEIIGRFNNFTANDKNVYLPLATNMAANNMGVTAHEKTLCTETESYICQEIRQHNDVSMFNEEIRNPSNCFNNMRQNIKKRKLSNKPACVETESYICKETLEQNDVSWYNKKSRNLAVATDMENRKLSHEHVAKLNNDIGLVSESQQQEFPYEFWTKRYNALVAYKQQYEHSSCTKNGKLSQALIVLFDEIGFVGDTRKRIILIARQLEEGCNQSQI